MAFDLAPLDDEDDPFGDLDLKFGEPPGTTDAYSCLTAAIVYHSHASVPTAALVSLAANMQGGGGDDMYNFAISTVPKSSKSKKKPKKHKSKRREKPRASAATASAAARRTGMGTSRGVYSGGGSSGGGGGYSATTSSMSLHEKVAALANRTARSRQAVAKRYNNSGGKRLVVPTCRGLTDTLLWSLATGAVERQSRSWTWMQSLATA